MNLGTEILNLLTTIAPPALALLPLIRPPSKIGAWVGSVLLTASMSVLSMGFLMMRLTARCVSRETPCPEGSLLSDVSPNIFASFPECSACVPVEGLSDSAAAAFWINGVQRPCAVAGAAVCTLISLAVLSRFAGWVKRQGTRS